MDTSLIMMKNLKIMIAKYKSGKCKAINLGGTIVKNGGGGFS